MPLSFLAPLFLAGVLAVAIPVLVHLTHKEKKDIQRFPSLMFVRRVPYRSTRRQTIRHWLLLLLRVAALVLIVAAFARPFLERAAPAAPGGTGARDLVVLLDRSFSMQYQGRWDAARREAERLLGSLGPTERATLVLFDERAEAIRAPDGDLQPLQRALRGAQPGALGTRYAPPLRLAQTLLQNSQHPRREIVLITDLQRSAWNTRERFELPAGTAFRVADVGRDSTANLLVAGVNFTRAQFAARERVTIAARVLNRSGRRQSVPVILELDGREAQRRTVTIEPFQAATVGFDELTLSSRQRGIIRAGTDALPADNRFYFVLAPGQAVPVSITRAPGNAQDESLYLERALSAAGDPTFALSVQAQQPPDGVLRPGAVAVLLDVVPSAADARRLKRFLEAGGGLLIVLGGRSGGWRGAPEELLPGDVGGTTERELAAPGRIASIQFGHRIFERFKAARAADFTSARIYRYRDLNVGDPAAVLARFDDGRVAVAEKKVGAGRVVVLTTPVDNRWNDLPVQPVFAPFVRELASYLAGAVNVQAWRTAGEVVDAAALLDQAGARGGSSLVVATPAGHRERLDEEGVPVLTLSEQGFYQVRTTGQGGSTPVAVNVSAAESDLSRLPKSELEAAVGHARTSSGRRAEDRATPAEHERRQSLWWYLLIGSVLLLVTESILSNRLSRVARA